MNYSLTDLLPEHHDGALAIFNHYVAHSMAAYPDTPPPADWMSALLAAARGYPAVAAEGGDGRVAGFGLLRPWHPAEAFRRVAEVTYFIAPEEVGKGLGGRMLEWLCARALPLGITSLLANVSSENAPSIAFHRKNGFFLCGRFRGIGTKFGRDFDVIWMQKDLGGTPSPEA